MRHAIPTLLTGLLLLAIALAIPVGQDRGQIESPTASRRLAASSDSGPATRPAGSIRVATWNIENWRTHFESFRNRGQRLTDPAAREARDQERFQNEEDNWEIAQAILDPAFAPDILVFQEGCAQAELEEFNKRWLAGAYETLIVFPSNDERGQTIGILLKPGFTVTGREDQFHRMPDEARDLNPRSDYLFARGPAFVLVQTPGGARLWVGTNHQKSKGGGNDVAITQWRNAEAIATQKIMKDLAAREPGAGVIFLADCNDELGIQAYELEGGGDVISNLVGPDSDGFHLATRELAEQGQASYMGYWRDDHRTFIDHVVLTPALAPAVRGVGVYDTPWARVASDHLPVYVDLALPIGQ